MKGTETNIRFGIMVNCNTVERWQYETIKHLTDNGITLSLVIENAGEPCEYSSLWDKIRRYP